MEFISELFIEIIFRRLIVGIFGYYTLFFFYKVTKNKKGLQNLTKEAEHEGEEFGRGCLISIVGLVSFTSLFILIGYLIMWITN